MKQLAEGLQSSGHKVTILTSFPHYDGNRIREGYRGKVWTKEVWNGLTILRTYLFVPKRKQSIPGRLWNYVTWNLLSGVAGIFLGKHDVVFVPSPPLTNGLVASLISRIRRIPFIYNVQDIYPDIAVRLGVLKGKRAIHFFRGVEKRVYSKSSGISVISEGFRQNLLSKGVSEKKIYVIPNFVDTDFIHPLPRLNKFSSAQEISDRFVVLFAGNVGLSQGLDRVLEAAALLSEHPEILFLIVGNGTAKPDLLELAQRLKLENVKFRPFFPYQDVPEMYASSDVCLVPLKRGIAEASVPSKVYSILAAAIPLIASVDEGSDVWRMVNEAKCGLCIPPEDPKALAEAVLNLYHDRELGVRMGANGRAHVERYFSRRLISKEYEQLFLGVMNEGA